MVTFEMTCDHNNSSCCVPNIEFISYEGVSQKGVTL